MGLFTRRKTVFVDSDILVIGGIAVLIAGLANLFGRAMFT